MTKLLGGFFAGFIVSVILGSMGIHAFEVQLVIASVCVLPFAYELFNTSKDTDVAGE